MLAHGMGGPADGSLARSCFLRLGKHVPQILRDFRFGSEPPPFAIFRNAALVLYHGAVEATWPVSGTHALCEMQLLPARFSVDLQTPAEAGGAKKIQR